MPAGRKAGKPPANRLLSLLKHGDYQRLRPHLHRVPLACGQSLYRARKPIEFVYFIETGVGSVMNAMATGHAIEVGTIGNEGMVGLPLVFGKTMAPTSVCIQIPGTGLRMEATQFERELARSTSMRALMLRYANASYNHVALLNACNHFHSIQQRFARWMLRTQDRMQSSEFPLAQKYLAMILGVQRTGISGAASSLQRAGLIRYKRGNVTILDRSGLKRRSCDCYSASKQTFDHLLGD